MQFSHSLTTLSAPGTFQSKDPYFILDDDLKLFLKSECQKSPTNRARINTHLSPDDYVQEMIICMSNESLVDVHNHIDKSESFHLIDGCLAVVLFKDNTTDILDTIYLGSSEFDFPSFYRLNNTYYHLVVPLTEYVIFHETTTGPFIPSLRPGHTIWNSAEAQVIVQKIRASLRQSYRIVTSANPPLEARSS